MYGINVTQSLSDIPREDIMYIFFFPRDKHEVRGYKRKIRTTKKHQIIILSTYVIYSYCYLSAIFAHSSDVLQFFWLFDLFDRYDLLYLLFFLIYKVHNFFLKQDTHLLTIITLFYALELGTIFILRKGVFGLFQTTYLPL